MYKPVDGNYVFQDKYFGRKVTIADFPSVLSFFLSNGSLVLSYHIPLILRQLYRLAGIIHSLDRFRFYAASLLFIYDGDQKVQERYAKSLREEVQKKGDGVVGEEKESKDQDHESWKGDVGREDQGAGPSTSTNGSKHHHKLKQPLSDPSPSSALPRTRSHSHSHRHPTTTTSKKSKIPGAVIIRLIDFAHCTTGDDYIDISTLSSSPPSSSVPPPSSSEPQKILATFPPTHPNQPDLGFLLGLKSLCAALKMIWKEEQIQLGTGKELEGLSVEGEMVFERIFGRGALRQGLGEGPGPEEVYSVEDLITA